MKLYPSLALLIGGLVPCLAVATHTTHNAQTQIREVLAAAPPAIAAGATVRLGRPARTRASRS